jgi:hypothetical protein
MKVYEVCWWEKDDINRAWFHDKEEAVKFDKELRASEEYEHYNIITHIHFRTHEVPNDVKVFVEWLNTNTH